MKEKGDAFIQNGNLMKHRIFQKPTELAISFKILIPSGIVFLLFVYFSFFVMLPFVEKHLMKQQRQMLISTTTGIISLLDYLNANVQTGKMPEKEAKRRALAAIRNLRYGPNGENYFWIGEITGAVLFEPGQPDLAGTFLLECNEGKACRFYSDALTIAQGSGAGFIEHKWPSKGDPSRIVDKLSYVRLYEPWEWIVGTGLYMADVKSEIAFLTRKLLWLLIGVMVVSLVFCFYVYQQALTVEIKRQRAEKINQSLIDISNAVNTTFDLETLYGTIHHSLQNINDMKNFFVAIYEEEKDLIAFAYRQDELDNDLPTIEAVHRSGSPFARVIVTQAPVFATRKQILEWESRYGTRSKHIPMASFLGVPLQMKDKMIGVMAAADYFRDDQFDETDLNVFLSVSDQLAVAIERKQDELDLRRKYEQTECILRESEERLLQSERLAATGQLAAFIAHEINSPLQGVTSLLNVIRREYGNDANLVAHLNLIKGAFNSIRRTVKNLLDLNRPGKEKYQPIHLQEILRSTGALVRSFLKDHGVRLNLELAPDLPMIMGSPQQLSQVFMNLINNAVESMNMNPENIERRITIHAESDEDRLTIHVEDTGPGIPKEDMPRIFDAFFTKKRRMGMGVGLFICHRILEGHNGTIWVENQTDRGARFTIRLPIRHRGDIRKRG